MDIEPHTRIEIPFYSSWRQCGERWGHVVSSHTSTGIYGRDGELLKVVRIKLEKSGSIQPFILDDCTVV